MDIRVRSMTGGVYPLSVKGGTSVTSLTQDISLLTGLPPSQLRLFSNSHLLTQHSPLHLSTGEEIVFLSKIRAGGLIYVKTYSGKIISFEVDLQFDTVEFVKNRIEEKIGVSKDQMILVFENTELRNEDKLCSYNIKREGTLHLVTMGQEIKTQTSGRGAAEKQRPKTGCCVIV